MAFCLRWSVCALGGFVCGFDEILQLCEWRGEVDVCRERTHRFDNVMVHVETVTDAPEQE